MIVWTLRVVRSAELSGGVRWVGTEPQRDRLGSVTRV